MPIEMGDGGNFRLRKKVDEDANGMGAALVCMMVLGAGRVQAAPFFFSTDTPDGRMAMASRPDSAGKTEIEAADDFITTQATQITSATFTGLIPSGAAARRGVILGRWWWRFIACFRTHSHRESAPSGNVPTRTYSPSYVAFDSRDSAASTLTFSTSVLSSSFTAANSVLNGINTKFQIKRRVGRGP